MIKIRDAVKQDSRFLARIILMAESTGHEIISYSKMFGMSNDELTPLIEKAIDNDMKGHQLTYHTYLVATLDDMPVAAISAYREGEFGDSNHLTTGALMNAFDRKKISAAFGFLKQHADMTIPKSKNTVQIDCVATLLEHRGKGFLKQLIAEAERRSAEAGVGELQIQVWKKNEAAAKAYGALGYSVVLEKLSTEDPENGKLLMTKTL